MTCQSRSGGRDASISYDFSLKFSTLSDCCSFLTSSAAVGIVLLRIIIDSTCEAVIVLEAAHCCGDSSLRVGMPKPPRVGGTVIIPKSPLGRGSVCPKRVGSAFR